MTLVVKPTSLDSNTKEKENRTSTKMPQDGACRRIQNGDELTVNVTGLYVPYEQNFVTETMFFFVQNNNA